VDGGIVEWSTIQRQVMVEATQLSIGRGFTIPIHDRRGC
jgi:hypothetical protein